MSEIMKVIDERKRQKNKDRKKQRSGASYGESVRAKWFCCTFKLGFFQLTELRFSLQNSLQSFESLFLIWCERLPMYGNLK